MKRIAVVPGDGVGAEVTAEAVRILRSFKRRGLPIQLSPYDYSADRYLATGESLPPGAIEDLGSNDAILMGAFGDPRVPDMAHAREILLGSRQKLDLYVNERPVRLLCDRLTPLKRRRKKDINFVILRENTEGEYLGAGGCMKRGSPEEVAVQDSITTRKGTERIVRHAFEYAQQRGYGSVLMSDKHNALRYSGDLWIRTFKEISAEYPGIEARHMFIDTLCMEMVLDPSQFEVIVTDNMFGDISSDIGAALIGGVGLMSSANYNPETGMAMFEPVHGSAHNIAGKNVANPMASVLSAAMMLHHLGFEEYAVAVEKAVGSCIEDGRTTRDIGGNLKTREVGQEILDRVDRILDGSG